MSVVSVLETPRTIWTRDDARLLVDLGLPNAEQLELIDRGLIQRVAESSLTCCGRTWFQECLRSIFGPEYVQMKRLVHVHRVPQQDAFTSVAKHRFDECLAPLADPDRLICLEQL
jgi:hypothetical protein